MLVKRGASCFAADFITKIFLLWCARGRLCMHSAITKKILGPTLLQKFSYLVGRVTGFSLNVWFSNEYLLRALSLS